MKIEKEEKKIVLLYINRPPVLGLRSFYWNFSREMVRNSKVCILYFFRAKWYHL